jgi:uncharacterized protein
MPISAALELAGQPGYETGRMTSKAPGPFVSVLASAAVPNPILRPLELDGYLTGILLTPHISPRQWIPGIWEADRPSYENDDQFVELVMSAIARQKEIAADLTQGAAAFRGSLVGHKAGNYDQLRIWVRGLRKAIRVDPDYWSDLMDDDLTRELVAVFTGFMEADEPLEEREDAADLRQKHADMLSGALVLLRELAVLQEEALDGPTPIRSLKIGRNKPCPCGSGKKYKRCCAD